MSDKKVINEKTAALKKSLQTKVLENWYLIDSVLLNGHAKSKIKSPKLFEQYVSLKAAFLHTLYEFYCHINFMPRYEDGLPKNVKALTEQAKCSAKASKKIAADILHKESVREALKKRIIREAEEKNIKDMDSFSDKIIKEKFIQFSLDNALIGLPLLESANKKALDDFKGQMLNESYKMYRNAIIQLARTCMN